ncbi:zinc finger protein 318 [Thalassophryne amazonica]|uniref:zinc finger protein 318 n=1 Tax=Thalassophryne amazonica TaxID=390379 RepID=UPI00147241FE|nr:zinc finger protein 318 [Thalassophryne amazonica]
MYRGRSRGSYPPPGPPRPYLGRPRPRAPYQPGYPDHGPHDSYRRSPPRRRYPSPGSGGHRGSDYWAGAPHRERSMSPRGAVPLSHNLVITVGNELTGQPGSVPSHLYDRDYSPRPGYERSHSRGRSPDRVSAKSHGHSKSRPRSQSRSPDRSHARSRGRSKSRPRSKSRSPDRSRARSRGRSKSRSPVRSRGGSWGHSKSRAPSKSRSPYRSRAKSRGRSQSRPRSKSRSRSRGRSCGPSYLKPVTATHSNSRARSRNSSSSSSSSSSTEQKEFKELAKARLKKELEETLNLPTKSILKKRIDCESPLLKTSGASQLADQLLQAVKGMAPHTVVAMLDELRSDPQMAQHAGLDSEIKEILVLLEGKVAKPHEKAMDDIDDEEKFLYGDSEDPKPVVPSEPAPHHSFSELYGDMSEEVLYGDFPQQNMSTIQPCGVPPKASPHVQMPAVESEEGTLRMNKLSRSPEPAYPPGTEPLEESERQALEEYEKIQDLLKTIGLDLGVTDISKMAARTKERLHGSKPPPKTPTRRKCHSSESSDSTRRSKGWDRRSDSGSSSSRSRAGSWSSDDGCRKSSPAPKSHSVKATQAERSDGVLLSAQKESLAQTPEPQPIPTVPITTYPSSEVHELMAPSYPPPGYNQYGNYMAYVHQRWSHLYPPPSIALPPQTTLDKFSPSLAYNQSYIQPVPEATPKVKCVSQENKKGSSKVSNHDKMTSEDQNNESQKQKVLEEREKLKADREVRMKKKDYLMRELERLRKQQGELLRKKRREKDGHKDPLLREISHLQEEVMAQISNLRKEHETAEKKCSEIEKVALILGLSPSDRPSKTNKLVEDQRDETHPPEKKKREHQWSPEAQQAPATISTKVESQEREQSSAPESAPCSRPPPDPFEYYDAGNHWCRNCNVTCGSMFDFFTHMHSKIHRKTLDPYDRPWASSSSTAAKKPPSAENLTKPAKGAEFMIPVSGFFCLLCEEFYGDAICAEEHVTRHAHNEKYKKLMYEDPLYEQRRNLDRQAGLTLEMSGKKRKHEGEEKEEKSKHKKDKKEQEKKTKEDNSEKEEKLKHKKEEDEKLSRKEHLRNTKNLEVKSASNKTEEDEKSKFSKKDEKYQYSREEEERDKHGKKDDDRHRYSREEEYHSRSRKEYDNKYEERSKYGTRDCDNKYKYSKYSDSKHATERDEGKLDLKKKTNPPPKPYDPPKIISGPSPAMRAKLRKQSLEISKPTPSASTSVYGKFNWKKRENVLAKEAEKVAAEFIKDDEEDLKHSPTSADPFSKSVAAAKEIAEKLAGKATMPLSWVSSSANRGRIRPNLPGPAAVLRKTALICKPASLNTFLSIRPQNAPGVEPLKRIPLFPDPAPTASADQTTPEEAKPVPCLATFDARPVPPVSEPILLESKPDLLGSKVALFEAKPLQPVSKPIQVEAKDVPPGVNPVPPLEVKPLPQLAASGPPVSAPLTSGVNPVLSVCKPAGSEAKPAAQVSKPTQPSEMMIKIVSDVAAPGVPESEQTRTVFVKPPPFLNICEGSQKSEKVKSNLAAAKAQALFDIFYSSIGQSGPSSVTKSATEAKKSPFVSPQSAKAQPQSRVQPLPQPLSQPKAQQPLPQPLSQPEAQQPLPQPLSQPEAQQPLPQPLSQPEAQQPLPQPLSQPEAQQPLPQPLRQPEAQQPLPQPLRQPEAQQPLPQPLRQPEAQQPLPQPLSQPEAQQPLPQPLSQPEAQQPLPQPLSQPEAQQPLPQPLSQPEAQQPLPQPLSQPEAQQPLPQPLSQPEAQQPLPQPLSQPEAQQPLSQPLSQPEAQQPLSQPLSQPEAQQPLSQPLSQPEAQQPLSQPLSQPEAQQPLPQPLSQPEAQPLSQREAQQPLPQPLNQPEAQQPLPQPLNQPEAQQPLPQPLSQPEAQQPLPQPLNQPEAQQPLPQPLSQPEAQQPLPQPLSQPEAQQPLPQPLSQPEAQQPLPQPLSQPEAQQPLPQPLSQPEAQQPLPQPLSQPEAQQPLPQPLSQPEAQSLPQPLSQPEAQSLPQPLSQPEAQPLPQLPSQPHLETEPEKQPNSIEIHSSKPTLQNVAFQTEPIPESGLAPPKITAECISVQSQSLVQKSEPHVFPQTNIAMVESLPQTEDKPQPKLKVVLQFLTNSHPVPQTEPTRDQDSQTLSIPETSLSLPPTARVPQSEAKPGPKSRGKSTAKKVPTKPIRQTRYQTRRQQLQQSKEESDPELDTGHTESAVPALKGRDLNEGSVSLPEKGSSHEDEVQVLEITPEALGLPSDMTSLDFDYDFDFE